MKRYKMRGPKYIVLRFEQFTIKSSGIKRMPRWRRRGQ